MLKKELYLEWAKKFPCVGEIWIPKYFNKFKRVENSRLLRDYCKFCQKTPDELLTMKDQGFEAELMLGRYVNISTHTKAIKFNTVNAVKSFYKTNFKELNSNAVKLCYNKEDYNKITKEILCKIYRNCTNPRDRAIFQFICSTACARFTVINAKWCHFEDNWELQEIPHLMFPSSIIKGQGQGKYVGVKQATFLTPQAKADLLEYKDWYETEKLGRPFKLDENIFWQIRLDGDSYNPIGNGAISFLFRQLFQRTKLKFSPHDGRRWVETALENNGVVSNWARRIRGRKVRGSESPYSRPAIEQLREKYAKAVPDLQFLPQSNKDIIDNAVASAMSKLRLLLDNPSIPDDKKEEAKQYLRNLTKKITKQKKERQLLESNPTNSEQRIYIF